MKAVLKWVLGLALALACSGAGAATFIHLDSPNKTYTAADGPIRATPNYRGGVTVELNNTFTSPWMYLQFAPRQGQTLTPGTYTQAERYSYGSTTHPGIEVFGTPLNLSSCYTITGRFDVLEIAYNGDGSVARFAADFEQRCDGGSPTVTGVVRFNSDVPLVLPTPIAYAGMPQIVDEAANVTLDGTASRDPGGSALTYEWSQTGGWPVTLANPSSASASFTAPGVSAGGVDLTFQLRVTNGAGASATATTSVHVMDAADPHTFLVLDSDAGDYVGAGLVKRYGPADGSFTATTNGYGGVSVAFNGGQEWWYLNFAPPTGQTFAPGTYSAAQRSSSAGRPGLDVYGNGRGCNVVSGTFVVHEIVVVAGGGVQRFAADFVQHCERGPAALFGSIRFASGVAFDPAAPIASAGPPQTVDEGAVVTLDGSASADPSASPLTYAWSQTGGPSITLANPSSTAPSFTAPAVAAGGADLTFELRVTNGVGRSATATVAIHVMDAADPHTFLFINSDPGDYIGGGDQRLYTVSDGTFRSFANYRGGVSIDFNGGTRSYSLDFGAPLGQYLSPGTYVSAERFPFASPARPALEITGNGGCNVLSGSFTVYEVVYGAGDSVEKFAADFEQHCELMVPALRGSIRINSSVPQVPATPNAYAGPAQTVDEGQTVTLDGSASRNPAGGSLTYAWSQVAGPAVTLSNPSSANPSFTAPAVAPGGADLTFELRVTNSAGLSSTATVTIHVRDAADPRTFIFFDSDPGDYIGGGVERLFTPLDGPFVAQIQGGALSVTFNGGLNSWYLNFGAPTGQPLIPGDYVAAQRFASAAHPQLDIYGSGRGCNSVAGQFSVLELVVVNATVQKFAADFVQHCEGGTPALLGGVRFNSNIPYTPKPIAAAGAPQTVDEGDTVRLNAAGSRDAAGGAVTYSWTQVSGPSVVLSDATSATPTFTAPAVAPGGATLVFRLTVTDGTGATATANVSVKVLDAADPHTFLLMDSDPGDWIGLGMQRRFTSGDGAFTASRNYRNGVSLSYFGGDDWWFLDFGPAYGQPFVPGTYLSAQRFAFAESSHPGIDVGGSGRGCNTIAGEFTVLEVVFAMDGSVERFAADFIQHCEGGTAALYGSIRFNSAVPLSALRARAALTASANTIAFGAAVTLTANVTGVAGTPTGTVAFRVGANVIPTCSAVPLVAGSASCSTTSLPPGTRNMFAVYSGNGQYSSSVSTAVSLTVNGLAAPAGVNWALANNGGMASASSTPSTAFDVSAVINDVRSGAGWGSTGGGWRDNTIGSFPDWVEVRFNGAKEISRVVVYGLQDAAGGGIEPTDAMLSNVYALRDFAVQGWNGAAWVDLGVVTGNFLVKRPVAFAPFTTDRIRVNVSSALNTVTRIVEIEAWGFSASTPGLPEPPSGRNVALAGNGGTVIASSIGGTGNFPVSSVIDGIRTGAGWGAGGGWRDATNGAFPDWVQVNFAGPRTIDRVIVYSLQDAAGGGVEPTDAMTFTVYGITAFTVEAWNGSAWVAVGSVSGNNLVKRTVTFAQTTTDRIRVNITGALSGVSRLVEIEAWEPGGGGGRSNLALSSTGAVATASSTGGAAGAFPPSAVNDGDVRGVNWGAGGGWKDATRDVYPDWVQIDFTGPRTIDQVVVYSLQDTPGAPVAPTDTMTSSGFALVAFTVEGWNGSGWTVLGTVTGNNLVKRSVSFSPFTTSRIRVNITNVLSGVSRLVELEAWGV